jgi:hypothetical protein
MRKIKLSILLCVASLLIHVNAYTQNCKWQLYNESNGLFSNYTQSVVINDMGTIAVLPSNEIVTAVSVFKSNNWYIKNFNPNIEYVSSFTMDNYETFYFSGWGLGLRKIKDTTVTVYDTLDGLPSMDIENMVLGHNNEIWMTSYGFGVVRFNGTTFSVYDTSFICDMDINKIVRGPNNSMYFSSWSGCITMFNGTTFSDIQIIPGDLELSKFIVDNDGIIWAIAYDFTTQKDKAFKYINNSWQELNIDFINGYVSSLALDKMGMIWIGTESGAYKYDGKIFRYYNRNNGLDNEDVMSLFIDNQNRIWFASYDLGLTVLTESSQITGVVKAGTVFCSNGKAYLYSKPANVKKMILIDSTNLDIEGDFAFTDLSLGTYLVYAEADKTSYPDYFGTYYDMADNWQFAIPIDLLFCDSNVTNLTINLIYVEPIPVGPGYISGTLKSLDGTRATAEPIKDVDVTLRKVPGGVIAKTKTNDNGLFEFAKLPVGTYGILIDLPGLEMDSIREVTITENDTTITGQDYGADSNGIGVNNFSSIAKNNFISTIKIAPNPSSGRFNIIIPGFINSKIEISIITLQGQIVLDAITDSYKDKSSVYSIELSEMPKGFYLIRLRDNKSTRFEKLLLH